MTKLSIRGLGDDAFAKLKARATKEGSSVNSLVLRLIEQGLGHARTKPKRRRHDDLDALAGSWGENEGVAFDRSTAPFAQIDAKLWS